MTTYIDPAYTHPDDYLSLVVEPGYVYENGDGIRIEVLRPHADTPIRWLVLPSDHATPVWANVAWQVKHNGWRRIAP
jgi:hypothetical protein